jgi:hypothetical protein
MKGPWISFFKQNPRGRQVTNRTIPETPHTARNRRKKRRRTPRNIIGESKQTGKSNMACNKISLAKQQESRHLFCCRILWGSQKHNRPPRAIVSSHR